MSLAFIGDTGCTVGTGRTSIDLSGTAITTGNTHRNHAAGLTAGDLVSGSVYRWTVYKSDGNYSTIVGTLTDAAPDTITSITWEDEVGTISAADTVDVILLGAVGEDWYTNAGTVLTTNAGQNQNHFVNLTAARTFTDSLTDGESIVLLVNGGATYAITWPTMQWVGGSAPTLAGGDEYITLWKEGSTLNGLYVGASS